MLLNEFYCGQCGFSKIDVCSLGEEGDSYGSTVFGMEGYPIEVHPENTYAAVLQKTEVSRRFFEEFRKTYLAHFWQCSRRQMPRNSMV